MEYVISGGLGFIGKNLTFKLNKSRKNHTLHILDKCSGDNLIIDPIIISTCDSFIHLAAATNVRESIDNPKHHILQNTEITLNCLNYARVCGSSLIFASSMGAPKSLSPYSASKLACEAFCKAYHESYNLNIKILRLSNVYGPHSLHKTSVIAKFIRLCLDKKPLTIIGNGLQTRDFVHVDDVVKAIIKPSKSNITNIATGEVTTILSLARMIRHLSSTLTSFTPEIHFFTAVEGEINQVDVTTDIKPTINLEVGLELTFKWFMEHYVNN